MRPAAVTAPPPAGQPLNSIQTLKAEEREQLALEYAGYSHIIMNGGVEGSDPRYKSPGAYWKGKENQWPLMHKLVMILLTLSPSSAECERVFSASGFLLSAKRHRMGHELLEARLFKLMNQKVFESISKK